MTPADLRSRFPVVYSEDTSPYTEDDKPLGVFEGIKSALPYVVPFWGLIAYVIARFI